jgi:hypothetical protein
LARLSIRSAVAGNIGELKVENSPYQGVADLQYDAGFRLEWTLFEGFERRNKIHLMKPGTSALFVLDNEGDMDVILHAIRGLGGGKL